MGKKKSLSSTQKKRIRELAALGSHSYWQIADKVGVSVASVHRVLKKNPKATNTKNGRPEKLDSREKRLMARYFNKNPPSLAEKAVQLFSNSEENTKKEGVCCYQIEKRKRNFTCQHGEALDLGPRPRPLECRMAKCPIY